MSTITLSSIPALTSAVSVPRLAAIEHPLGYLLGQPGDRNGQRAVLQATLKALAETRLPGTVTHLSFDWPEECRLNAHPPQAPPITKYLLRRPWHIPNLLSRNIPPAYRVQAIPAAD